MRGDGSREEERTVAPSLARRETFPCPNAKEERRDRRRHEPGEDGEFMEISSSTTVMHVSPISVTERLLAAFCPRDNSPQFFMAGPISQLKNYSRKVGILRNVENMCDGHSSLSKT